MMQFDTCTCPCFIKKGQNKHGYHKYINYRKEDIEVPVDAKNIPWDRSAREDDWQKPSVWEFMIQ